MKKNHEFLDSEFVKICHKQVIQHSVLNSKSFYEIDNSAVSLKIYWIMYLPNLQDVRSIPFQKFVESLSSELTFRLKLKLNPRLHFEFVPARIIGRLFETKTIRPSTFIFAQFSFLNFDTCGNQSLCQSQTRLET